MLNRYDRLTNILYFIFVINCYCASIEKVYAVRQISVRFPISLNTQGILRQDRMKN